MKRILNLTFLIGTLLVSCSNGDDNSTIENNCDSTSEIIMEEDFNEIDTSTYEITEVQLTENCLEISISSSGCDPELWEMNLYSSNAFYTVYPLQRAVKMKLTNEQECLAVFQKSISFDLTPFQIEGQNEVPLNIEGWNEQIIYEY